MTTRFSVEERQGPIPQLVLRDGQAGSELWVAPSRGALATRFFDGAREVLYLDEPTLIDRSKNVRGGIPVLFPSPGKLEGDRFVLEKNPGALKQHGFARTSVWAVAKQETAARAEVTLSLESTPETLREYPWAFRVELTFALHEKTLRLEIRVANTGPHPMPYGFGFHPYFRVPLEEKAAARIDTASKRAWDNVRKEERALGVIALGEGESDLHLLDHNSTDSALFARSGAVALTCSPHFNRWVIWTLPGKEFVCLEPWTSPANALNSGKGLLWLEPGKDDHLWVEMVSR